MDLILRFTRESGLPNAKSSSISLERSRGSDESYFVTWAASEEEMAAQPPFAGTQVTLPAWSSEESSKGPALDWIWALVPAEARQKALGATEPVQLLVESGNVAIDLLPWESL